MKRFAQSVRALALALLTLAIVQPAAATDPAIGTANQVWRDYTTDGVPASGVWNPRKSDIRAWGSAVENTFAALVAGQAAGSYAFDTLAHLNALTAAPAHAQAFVYADPTSSNNGIYGNTGTSTAAVWTKMSGLVIGPYPVLTLGTVTIAACNASPSASIGGSSLAPVLNLTLPSCNYDGAIPLPTPTASTRGGVYSTAGAAGQYAYGIDTSGNMLRRSLSQSDIPGLGTFQAKIQSQDSFGDSITAGYAASISANNYVSLIGTTLGLTPVNHGVSGREAVDQATDIHAFAATDTGSQLVTYMTGTNDGTFYGTDVIRVMNWKIIHQEQLAWLSMPARAKTTGQGSAPGVVAAPTYAGTWTDWGTTPQTVTISIASPGVITLANHGLGANTPFVLSTTGVLPSPLVAGTTYYVCSGGGTLTQNTFQICSSINGSPLATTGSQSGTHSLTFTSMSKASSTQGSTATFTGFGRTLYLAYGIQDGNGGSFIVTVDPHAATISIASPGVITETAHGRHANDPVRFDTNGALPTGLVADTIYYVVGSSITTNTYQVSATAGGAAINTSGTQSGTHTVGTPFQKTYVIDPAVNSTTTFSSWDAAGIYVNGYGARSTIQTMQGATHASALLRITGLTRAAHTIVAKVTSATGAGNVVWFDWFGQPHGSFFLSGPTVIAAGPPRSGTDAGNALNQPYNEYVRYDVGVMQHDGLNVGFAGVAGYIKPATDLIADNTHPNDSGMSHIADAFLSAINTNSAARTRQSGEALTLAEGSSAGMVRTDTAGNAIIALAGVDYMAGDKPTFTGWINQSPWFPALADYGLPYQASTRGAGTTSAFSINKEGSYGVNFGYSNGATIGSAFTGGYIRIIPGDHFAIFTGSTNKGLDIDASGNVLLPVTAPNGLATLDASGKVQSTQLPSYLTTSYRNKLRNATFSLNQRAVSGTVFLGAGQYGHDGVKGGASAATYTFATSGLDTTITVVAGSLIMPVEAGMIEGGVYTFSQAGTAQCRVWQGTGSTGSGSYAAAPFATASLTANTQTNVECSTGTILRPQFELGGSATAFERRLPSTEAGLNYRYFQRYYYSTNGSVGITAYQAASSYVTATFAFQPMASTPTYAAIGIWTSSNASSTGASVDNASSLHWFAQATALGAVTFINPSNGGFSLSAELN